MLVVGGCSFILHHCMVGKIVKNMRYALYRGSQLTVKYLIYMRYYNSKIWADNRTYWAPLYFNIKFSLI